MIGPFPPILLLMLAGLGAMIVWAIYAGTRDSKVLIARERLHKGLCPGLGTEHLLLGIAALPDSAGGKVLTECGLNADAVRAAIESWNDEACEDPPAKLPATPALQQALWSAWRIKHRRKDLRIHTAHLLLALLCEPECAARASCGEHLPAVHEKTVLHLGNAVPVEKSLSA